jgi:ribulose-5-phosphate 4-epimerase/fuculose-1-phosphate aldolase
MHAAVQPAPAALHDLIQASTTLGADPRLVQGAGGNLSVKSGDTLWIKASGTRLREAADRRIFVPMALSATRDAVLVTEDLLPLVLPGPDSAGLRPSIETALHALLPHRVVFHVHGIGSLAAGLTGRVDDEVAALPPDLDTVVVPYAKPGVELARAVLVATGDRLRPDRPVVLLLVNHGLVVGARDCDQAVELIHLVESAFRSAPAPEVAPTGDRLCPAGTVDQRATDVLCAGALTPDSAVFLGPAPFGRIDAGPPGGAGRHRAFVADDGSVWLDARVGEDEREIVASLVDAARQVRGHPVTTLSEEQVDELVDWEAEKWRHQQKR